MRILVEMSFLSIRSYTTLRQILKLLRSHIVRKEYRIRFEMPQSQWYVYDGISCMLGKMYDTII